MSAGLSALFHHDRRISTVSVVPPQDGGWSLTPMENLFLGMRTEKHPVCLEIYGSDGVVSYQVRTEAPDPLVGMFNSYFPQSRVSMRSREPGMDPDPLDWLHLAEDEQAFVQTVHLGREPFLPLRIFDDNRIREQAVDPLAGVIGLLSSSTSLPGASAGSDRMGVRLLMRPAAEDWGQQYQSRMQRRRDGDDRARQTGGATPSESGPPMALMVIGGVIAGVVFGNYSLWDKGMSDMLLPFNMAATVGAGAAIWALRKFSGGRSRDYLDEELIEKKLKSLAFHSELQLVRIYRHVADEYVARASLDNMLHCIGSFDDPAGNSWLPGRIRSYSGQAALRDGISHPFQSGDHELSWLDGAKAKRTLLSAREAATVWHPPLGVDEMAPMERVASTSLVPFLSDLAGMGEDSGPLIGTTDKGTEIRLPESAVRKHTMILGKSGVGKSTLIKHVVGYKLDRKAAGHDDTAIVIVDPHSDLVHDILTIIPPEVVPKVRLLDFGREDRVPGLNLLDPLLFPNRDRCVDTIVTTVRYLWETWGNRLEDLLRKGLSIIYEYNSHPDTPRSKMMTILDILKLLDDGDTVGSGPNARTVASAYQREILSRCTDPRLEQWFHAYLNWPRDTRAEAVGPVHSRIGAYASNERASVVMGMKESTITLDSVLSEGLVLLVATASGVIGQGPAALMGGTVISLLESALRDQEKLPGSERKKCLLVCDEFQTITGANWEGMFAEIRKYGCSMMLATQSLARLDVGERRLRSGIMGNVGCIVAHQMAAEDARLVAPEMDEERVGVRDLVNINPRSCIVRINSDTTCYAAFSMATLPPPDAVHGSDEASQAVILASESYTVDFAETRALLNEEIAAVVAGSKKGSDGGSGSDPFSDAVGTSPRRDGSGSRDGSGGRRGGRPSPGAREGGSLPAESEGDGPDKLLGMLDMLRNRREELEAEAAVEPGSVEPGSVEPGSVEPGSVEPGSVEPGVDGEGAGNGVAPTAGAVALPTTAGRAAGPARAGGSVGQSPGGADTSARPVRPVPTSVLGTGIPDTGVPVTRVLVDHRPDSDRLSDDPGLDRDPGAEREPEPIPGPSPPVGGRSAPSGRGSAAGVASPSGLPAASASSESRDTGVAPRSVPVTSDEGKAFAPVRYSPVGTDLTGVRRISSGPLRGIPAADVENSQYSQEFLEELMQVANHDPGVRRVIDKRVGDHGDRVRRDAKQAGTAAARADAGADLEEALRLKDAEMSEAIARAREEALAQARVELGVQIAAKAESVPELVGGPSAERGPDPVGAVRVAPSSSTGGVHERGLEPEPGGAPAAHISERSGGYSVAEGSFGYDVVGLDAGLEDAGELIGTLQEGLGGLAVPSADDGVGDTVNGQSDVGRSGGDDDDFDIPEPPPPVVRARPSVMRRRS